MEYKKGKIYIAVPIMVLAIVVVYYFFNFRIESRIHPEKTAHNMAELNALVLDKIDAGAEKADFYVTGITEEQIMNINENLCSMNGMVDQYSITEKSKDGLRVTFTFEISDNYYVYEKYVNNQMIPPNRPSATRLYEKVTEVISRIIQDGMTDYEKELAIHDYIVSHCKYGYVDESKEYAYRAYGVLIQNKAVCNGYAEAMALLLSCVGVENKIITGTADDELHAWNLVQLDNQWYQVDSTWDDPLPDRGTAVRHQYFNVPDNVMDVRHNWANENFPSCDADTYNYFTKNNLICDKAGFEQVVKDVFQRNSTGTVEVLLGSFDPEQDFQFMQDMNALQCFAYNEEPYGPYVLVTIYLNQRQ